MIANPPRLSRPTLQSYLNKTLRSRGAGLVFTRYGVALLVIGEALLFARLLGSGQYGAYALVVQTAALLLFAVTGSASGYVYAHFREPGDAQDAEYAAIAAVHHFAVALLAAAVLYQIKPMLAVSGLAFLIYGPYYVTEPLLRVQHRYTISVLAKGFGSAGTCALALMTGLRPMKLQTALMILIAGNLAGYTAYYFVIFSRGYLTLSPARLIAAFRSTGSIRRYWANILRPGIPINFSGVLYLILAYVDRSFIAQFRAPATLSSYSLAWQLVQGALLLLTSMNVISSIRLGEQHKQPLVRETMRHHLLLTGAAGIAANLGLALLSWILSVTLYRSYRDLVAMSVAIGTGYLAHGVAGSVTSFLTYHRRFTTINLIYGATVVCCIATNYAAVRLGYSSLAAICLTSCALLAMSAVLTFHSFSVARSVEHADA